MKNYVIVNYCINTRWAQSPDANVKQLSSHEFTPERWFISIVKESETRLLTVGGGGSQQPWPLKTDENFLKWGRNKNPSDDTASFTHVWLAAVGSASVAAHFGRLHGLSQWDGVGLVLFVHILTVIVLWLAVLDNLNGIAINTWSTLTVSIVCFPH